MEATADAANAAESRRYFVGAWIGLAVLPFFHPAYAIVFGASLAIAMAFQRARGTLPRHHLAVVLTPVPFVVLYVGIYAHMAHPRVPFAVTMAGAPARALSLLRWGGLWCPAALFGAMRGRFALRPHLLSLAATTAMMAIFTTNAANNLAWTYNPFAVACALLAGCGLSALIAAAPRAGALLASVQLGLGYVGARYDVDLLEDARGKRRGPPGRDEIELASWIRSHVTDDQGIAVEPRSLPALRAVVATASHPVWLGPAYLLQLTEDPGTLDTLIAQNDRVLHAPCDAEVDRARVRYVVADREASSATIAAWKPFDAAVFENGAFVVYDTRRRGTCPP
jgi:hypothetical protein